MYGNIKVDTKRFPLSRFRLRRLDWKKRRMKMSRSLPSAWPNSVDGVVFWGVILIYIPAIWLSLRLTNSDRQTFKVFAVWFLFIIISSLLTATGRCPRCGNFFHVNGFIPLYLRRCLHCGLHITADKKQRKEQRKEQRKKQHLNRK